MVECGPSRLVLTRSFWHKCPGKDDHREAKASVHKVRAEAAFSECRKHAGGGLGNDKVEEPLAGSGHAHVDSPKTRGRNFLIVMLASSGKVPANERGPTEVRDQTTGPHPNWYTAA